MSISRKTFKSVTPTVIQNIIKQEIDLAENLCKKCKLFQGAVDQTGWCFDGEVDFDGDGDIFYVGLTISDLYSLNDEINDEIAKYDMYCGPVQQYILSLQADQFVDFRQNFSVWLLSCCQLDLFKKNDDQQYKYIIAERYKHHEKHSLALFAPEALELYIDFLADSIDTTEYRLLIQTYRKNLCEADLSSQNDKYLKYCLETTPDIELSNLSAYVEQINETKSKIIQATNNFHNNAKRTMDVTIQQIALCCSDNEMTVYNEWLTDKRTLLYNLAHKSFETNDYKEFVDIYKQLSTYTFSVDYVKQQLNKIYDANPHIFKYMQSANDTSYYLCNHTDRWLLSHPDDTGELTKAYISIVCKGSKFVAVAECSCGCKSSCVLRSYDIFVVDGLIYHMSEWDLEKIKKMELGIANPIINPTYPFNMYSGNYITSASYINKCIDFSLDTFVSSDSLKYTKSNQMNLISMRLYNKYMYTNCRKRTSQVEYANIKARAIEKYSEKTMDYLDLLYILNIRKSNIQHQSIELSY